MMPEHILRVKEIAASSPPAFPAIPARTALVPMWISFMMREVPVQTGVARPYTEAT